MTPFKPYLLRATYDWIHDNGLMPYLLVKAVGDLNVPSQHIKNGEITLNVAARAVSGLSLGDSHITFSARFSGVSRDILIPIDLVAAIYAQENGKGMIFDDLPQDGPPPASDGPDTNPMPARARPHLKVVK